MSADTTDPAPAPLFSLRPHAGWIRLRTLILLRWVAILGQLAALIVAQRYLGLALEYGWCYLAVGISAISNLVAMFVFPENKRLGERQNFLTVIFDLLQLGFLLFMTGGLHNPFALLLMGPVTISAATLSLRSYLIVACTAIALVTLLSQAYFPLRDSAGQEMRVPDLFLFGNWIALVIGMGFLGSYARRITDEVNTMSQALSATQMALAREQKLTDLGGVVAAAAHELGTPLATIKLTSSELIEELHGFPLLQEDAALIREQADRCRDILRDMGRIGKEDLHLRQAPLAALLEEAALPHQNRGITIHYEMKPDDEAAPVQPTVLRLPEVVHGLRNLVQNAVDFASTEVAIEARWTTQDITVRIVDDGPGFPSQIIGRIGEPFVRHHGRKDLSGGGADQRSGYEGMGLGLFIAKTLLERSGAEITFANGRDLPRPARATKRPAGAIVQVTWPRHRLEQPIGAAQSGLRENRRIAS